MGRGNHRKGMAVTAGLVRQKYTLERALIQGAAMAHRPRAEYVAKFYAGEIWCTPCKGYHSKEDMIRRRTKTTGYDNVCKEQAIVRAILRHLKTGRTRTTNNPTVLRMLRQEREERIDRERQAKEESTGTSIQGEKERTPADSGIYWRPVDPRTAR